MLGFLTFPLPVPSLQMVMGREMELLLKRNVLLCDTEILCIAHRSQRSHCVCKNWPCSGYIVEMVEKNFS
jgi:hypothetical protein